MMLILYKLRELYICFQKVTQQSIVRINMNRFALFTLFAFVIATTTVHCQDFEKAVQVFNHCKEIHKISDDEVAMIKAKEGIPSSKEAKCVMACMLKEGKLIIGSTFMKDNALIMADAIFKDDADAAAKGKEVVEQCTTEVGTDVGPDECEYAYKLAVCSEAHAKKIGAKRPI
ncbi:hypothetical protein O3M35_000360 [Rhynocoris fuscipes]|uniref:Uncharacterized protein n=1 Tax=Rhynocoris fuscipes TaxID=488301 RepID=A0AAW1DR88_9HEMI